MNGKKLLGIVILVVGLSLIFATGAAAWSLKQAPLMTQWASQVDPANTLPEYPRPQMSRTDWLNLNGVWQFKSGAAGDPVPVGQNLGGDILVPFPVESAISGVMQHYDRLWYRRTFTVPAAWSGKRVRLNFGAIDWESEVYINGTSLGIHKGGYDPFSYDITSYLVGTGAQELIVRVYDPTEAYGQPRGKQTTSPGGIMYTPTTGIWQTVWLEPVVQTGIKDIKLVPDLDSSSLKLTVNQYNSGSGITVSVKVKDSGTVIQTATGNPGAEFSVGITNPKLWSPNSPFLYDLEISLMQSGSAIDTVTSYFGMREVQMGNIGGVPKLLLNNQFVFQMGPLDQGFWPDGIYTAPTDAALKFDIEQEKALGFNMVRKHIKVEPYRWYYWADKLGLMVWQDMPSANSYIGNPPPIDTAQYELELNRMVQNHWNSPSIIMWVVFNEGQGQFDTARLCQVVAGLDPTRLINQASGGGHYDAGHVLDIHSYPPPAYPTSTTQAMACGEYGGIGYKITGHIWDPNSWGYTMVNNADEFAALYDSFSTSLTDFKTNNGLSAAVYTQITDVEIEINGILTYDRLMKIDVNKNKASNEKTITKLLSLTEVLPSSKNTGRTWKYTTSTPASNWYATGYSDSAWSSGQAGFGTSGTPGAVLRTTWNTADIWMRQQFNPGTLTADDLSNLVFYAHHDEDCEIYINGVLAASVTGYTSSYGVMPMNQAGKNALISNGTNLIAVHCHQTGGGQYIDAGISKAIYVDSLITNFSDDFNDGNANGWTTYGGTWSVTSGQYTVGANSGAKSVADYTSFSNFTYDADVTIGAAGDAGLIFRVTNPATGMDSYTGYYAGINSAGSVVLGKANNNWTLLATFNMTITPNTQYHLRVVADNSNIKVFVTDMAAAKINFSDSSYTGGAIGVRTFNADAKFDNVSVSSTVPVPTDYVGCWKLDETSGTTAADSSGGGNPGTVSGATWTTGHIAGGLSFDGTNDYVSVNRTIGDDFTIAFWVKTTQTGGTGQWYQGKGLVDGECAGATNDFGTVLSGAKFAFGVGNPDTTITSTKSINDGVWHHCVATRQKSTGAIRIFVDGVPEASGTGGIQSLTTPVKLRFGSLQTNINFFSGQMDDIRVYNRVLTNSEIAALAGM